MKNINTLEYLVEQEFLQSIKTLQSQQLNSVLTRIAKQNQQLLDCTTPTFLYRKKWYPDPLQYQPSIANRKLHESLREQVAEVLQPNYQMEVEITKITWYIHQVVTRAHNLINLKKLIPPFLFEISKSDKFTGLLGYYNKLSTDIWSDQQIKNFRLEYAEYLTILQNLLMVNLISTNS